MSKPQKLWVEILQTAGLSLFLALGIRQFVAEARYIPTGSMEPTLQINDRLMIEKISYRFNPPQRGDVVVFWPPEQVLIAEDRAVPYIKRVVGLPGDEVAVQQGQVFINGEVLAEPYIKTAPEYQWGPAVVPADAYLVLGDNRNNSLDSHIWGYVPQERIIGRALVRFWPPERVGGIR